MKNEGIECELTYMPRVIMTDLCNMGVKFADTELPMAFDTIRRSGLPGCRIYKEIVTHAGYDYAEVIY
jgi:hypothetical protein